MPVEAMPEWELTPSLEAAIAGLLARCFDTDFGGRSFFQQRHDLRLVLRREGALAGHLAMQWRAVRLGDRLATVAGLAEVATDPAARGQGVARTLLDAAVARAEASPAEAVLLFGTAALYPAAGFRPAGNPLTWTAMDGARTGTVERRASASLKVLPLRGGIWDGAAPLDLLGPRF